MVHVDSSLVVLVLWLGGLGLLMWRWADVASERLAAKAAALIWLALPLFEPAVRQDIQPWVRDTLAGEPPRDKR